MTSNLHIRSILLVLLCFFLFQLQGQQRIRIDLKLLHLPDNKQFYLLDFDREEQIIDSAFSHQGMLTFKTVFKEPFMAAIQEVPDIREPNSNKVFTLFVDEKPVKINGDYFNFSNITVNNRLNEINKYAYQMRDSISHFYRTHGAPRTNADYENFNLTIAKFQAAYERATLLYALKNPNVFSSLYIFSRSLTTYHPDTILIYFNLLDAAHQKSRYGQKIKNHISSYNKIKTGQPCFNIAGLNSAKDTVRLSDFAGKVILLDFWSAGCGPCILQKPYLRELAVSKKDSGLVIVSFSLDISSKIFIQSTKGEPWVNITDLKGFFSDAAVQYGISSLPALFLIDRKGNIRGIYNGYAFGEGANADKDHLISELLKEQ